MGMYCCIIDAEGHEWQVQHGDDEDYWANHRYHVGDEALWDGGKVAALYAAYGPDLQRGVVAVLDGKIQEPFAIEPDGDGYYADLFERAEKTVRERTEYAGAKAGKTCDRDLCARCRVKVGKDKDYCPTHARLRCRNCGLAGEHRAGCEMLTP